MKYNIIIVSVIVLIFLGSLMFLNFKTGNVLIEYEESFKTNEALTGKLSITVEQGDSINKDSQILLSLSKENEIILTKTISIEEFVQLSGKNPQITQKADGSFYETPDVYTVDVSKIIQYTFDKPGQYELFFSILELDIAVKKKITVN